MRLILEILRGMYRGLWYNIQVDAEKTEPIREYFNYAGFVYWGNPVRFKSILQFEEDTKG